MNEFALGVDIFIIQALLFSVLLSLWAVMSKLDAIRKLLIQAVSPTGSKT